jgi:hypothetical protein
MAVAKTILKNTNLETVVKVAGTAAATTISLATDCLATTQALDGATQTANIFGVTWTGAIGGIISITRNSVVVMTLQADAAGTLEFGGQAMIPETVNNTSDIVVTISGAQAECWLKIRKIGGYATKVETAVFGAYDNQSVVGS